MNMRKMVVAVAGGLMFCLCSNPTHAQAGPALDGPALDGLALDGLAKTPWHSEHVVYVAGLSEIRPGTTPNSRPEIKPNSAGSLSLRAETLDFASKDGRVSIPYARITAVAVGDERVATGGTSAKVARAIPFFGFGAAMGAATNKKAGLLTVEFGDETGGHHGAVFEMPKAQAALAQQQLVPLVVAPGIAGPSTCRGVAPSNAILVGPIVFTETNLPAEYRVLLYEQLINELQRSNGDGAVYRVGDGAAPCGAKVLQLSVTAFKKGNEAVRVSTGPVGLFVGGTSVRSDVKLVDMTGTVLFEKSLKASRRGDGDSLNVTLDLAKSVSKRLAKAKQVGTPDAT